MIQTSLDVARYIASGKELQWAIRLKLLQGTVFFCMDGMRPGGDLFKYNGEIKYDGTATYGSLVTAFYNVIAISPLEQGDIGSQTTVNALESRRAQFTADLANATGEIGDMMATEAFVGKDAELMVAYPGLPQSQWPILFTGEVSHVVLDDEKVRLEMRTA